MKNLGGNLFHKEDGLDGLYNSLKSKMIPRRLSIWKALFPLPALVSLVSAVGNRIPLMGGRINQYQHSFYPEALESWNKLDPNIRQVASLSKFRRDVFSLIRFPKKGMFNIHDPKGLRRLFQFLNVIPTRTDGLAKKNEKKNAIQAHGQPNLG